MVIFCGRLFGSGLKAFNSVQKMRQMCLDICLKNNIEGSTIQKSKKKFVKMCQKRKKV